MGRGNVPFIWNIKLMVRQITITDFKEKLKNMYPLGLDQTM